MSRNGRSDAARLAPAHRKAQLLAAAKAHLLEHGYANTSVSAIVREVGVAQGTFYLYFDSKARLLAELQAEVFRAIIGAYCEAAESEAPPDERLATGLVAAAGAVVEQQAMLQVFRQAATGEEIERTQLDGRESFSRPIAALLAEGVESGHFSVAEPRMCAHLALALFDNLLYEAATYGRPGTLDEVLETGLEFMLRGLGVASPRAQRLARIRKGVTRGGASEEGS